MGAPWWVHSGADWSMPALSVTDLARRVYYGWYVVLACNFVACITWGVAIFNQGVFAAQLVTLHGWSPAALSVGPVLFHIWGGIAGIVVGRVVDRHGPRPVLLAGAGFICLALAGFVVVSEVWHTYVVFVVLGTGFACIHTITLGKIVARWFVRQRSRAMAMATIGAGIGGAVLVPLNASMMLGYGIAGGSLALIVVTVLVIVPIALWVVKDGPEVLGLEPDGDGNGTAADPPAGVGQAVGADQRVWSSGEAMRTVSFWGLSFCFALGMVAQSSFLFHQVPFLTLRLGLMGAASVVTVTTLCGIAGRLAFIAVGDRLPVKAWMAIMLGLQALAFVVFVVAEDATALTIGSAMFGVTMGVLVTLQPLATAQVFGQASFGRIYGMIYMWIRVGAALGPGITGLILGLTGQYVAAWLILAGCLGLALAALPWAVRAREA